MSKRTRTESGMYSKQRVAAAIGARTNAKYPYRDFGRSYARRGVVGSDNMAMYGPSYKEASDIQKAARKAHGYVGRGGFFADLGKWAGRGIGGLFGNKDRGGRIGGGIGSIYEKLSGKGLYEGRGLYSGRGLYDSNSLVTGPNHSSRPLLLFEGSGDETSSLIMTQKEYIGDVFAPNNSNFSLTSYELNPGLTQNFPFLAQYAQNFEEYEFEQLVFEYHSTVDASSTNNPNGNTGTVIMATNYNASAPVFSDKEQMIQYHGGVSGRMTDNLVHGVECEPSKNAGSPQKYIRTFVPINQDLKTYDLGKFQLAFQNIPASYFNQQVGELWVHYKIRLTKPRLFSAQSGNVQEFRMVTAPSFIGVISSSLMPTSTTTLTCLGNSLRCLVEPFATGNKVGHRLTFPASANGVFEVCIKYISSTNIDSSQLVPPSPYDVDMTTTIVGNVTPWLDMFGDMTGIGTPANNTIGTLPPTWNSVYHHSVGTTIGPNGVGTMMICRVQVKSATAGIDNSVAMAYLSNGTIRQAEVTVREISPFLATGGGIAVPQYANPSGQIVATY